MKIKMKNYSEEKDGVSCNSTNNIRISVLGKHNVGKSALTVRYLTRRFIGEYKTDTDIIYRQTLPVNNGTTVDIKIVDLSPSNSEPMSYSNCSLLLDEIRGTDAFIVLYSITDRESFELAENALQMINSLTELKTCKSPIPSVLLGNKNDLEHFRVVSQKEAVSASEKHSLHSFHEISVSENSQQLYDSFQSIISLLIHNLQHASTRRKFSVPRLLRFHRFERTRSSHGTIQMMAAPASIIKMNKLPINAPLHCDASIGTNSSDESSVDESNLLMSSTSDLSSSHGQSTNNYCSSSKSVSDGSTCSNLSDKLSFLKSKLAERHSMKKRQCSPPICSL